MKRYGTYIRPCRGCGSDLGPVNGRIQYCSDDCKPRCSVEGCQEPKYSKDGLCAAHDSVRRNRGTLEFVYVRTPEADSYVCMTCGDGYLAGTSKSRKFCTPRCEMYWRRHEGNLPDLSFKCARCGNTVERDRSTGDRCRIDRKLCDVCFRSHSLRHKVSANEVANAKGTVCGLCGYDIDMSLRFPDKRAVSIDHIVPYSMGGTRDMDNLQLAHYSCNSRKQASDITVLEPPEGVM